MNDILSKWGKPVAERGFAQIPNLLFRINDLLADEYHLTTTEMVLLLHLLGSWWEKEKMPFPSMHTLAKRAGISERQVQRSLKALEEKGYIKKEKAKQKGIIASNVYDLTPVVEKLNIMAEYFTNPHPRTIRAPKLEMAD